MSAATPPSSRESRPAASAAYAGITLRRRLRACGALSLVEAAYLFDALAETVDTLHGAGESHGGICSDNVRYLSDGSVRILPPSPAIVADAPTRAADLRALGALLFDVLTGAAAPVDGPRTRESLLALGPKFAPAAAIVDRACAPAGAGPYESARAMASALWAAVRSQAAAGDGAAAAPPAAPPLGKRAAAVRGLAVPKRSFFAVRGRAGIVSVFACLA